MYPLVLAARPALLSHLNRNIERRLVVDERSIAPSDFGGLIRALERLMAALGEADWRDRVVYLTR